MLHLYKPKTIIIDVQKKKICTSTMVLKYRDSKHTIFYYFPWLLKFLDLTLIRYIIVWTLFLGGGIALIIYSYPLKNTCLSLGPR